MHVTVDDVYNCDSLELFTSIKRIFTANNESQLFHISDRSKGIVQIVRFTEGLTDRESDVKMVYPPTKNSLQGYN